MALKKPAAVLKKLLHKVLYHVEMFISLIIKVVLLILTFVTCSCILLSIVFDEIFRIARYLTGGYYREPSEKPTTDEWWQ